MCFKVLEEVVHRLVVIGGDNHIVKQPLAVVRAANDCRTKLEHRLTGARDFVRHASYANRVLTRGESFVSGAVGVHLCKVQCLAHLISSVLVVSG